MPPILAPRAPEAMLRSYASNHRTAKCAQWWHALLFNSLTFAVFFAIVLGLHNLALPWRTKKINLLIASYIFYAAWSPPFVILLWISTAVDWKVASWISAARTRSGRRLILALSLAANLGFLGYFKYGIFIMENFAQILRMFACAWSRSPSGCN